jgi:hypothetical protein
MFAQVTTKSYTFTQSLEGWPPWLTVAVATILAALAIWVLMKVLKWALWLLFFVVLFGGLGWAAWLWLR